MYKKVILLFFYLTSSNYQISYHINDTVNLRQGPSFEYPIKIFYKKKYLPVLIQDKSGNFKKIRDHENNSGWIHVSQLSKKNESITVDKNEYIDESEII